MTETSAVALATVDQAPEPGFNSGYWHELIPETEAAEFLDLTPRSMQAMRQRGGGPPFFRLSARCIKYTRFRCRIWYDARLRSSTCDQGEAA